MNSRVQNLIDRITSCAVANFVGGDVLQEAHECRFGVFDQDKNDLTSFAWICLDVLEVEEPKDSGNKVKKLWAHTNDFDGMVYGWSNCEFAIVETNLLTVMNAISDFLSTKFAGAQRIRVQYHRPANNGQSQPVLVAESDTFDGEFQPMPEFPSLC